MGAFSILTSIFGTDSDRQIKKYRPIVKEINELYETLSEVSIQDLRNKTIQFQEDISKAKDKKKTELENKDVSIEEKRKQIFKIEQDILNEILPEAFAMVKEICRRLKGEKWTAGGQEIIWDMVPFDVQIIGGITLHQGNIAEMKTGEGKTLVATMPIFLNALTGNGVHVVTVNDYLAKRDSEWMGRIFTELGLSVGCIINSMQPSTKHDVYKCDIVYGTNNDFGFDYLRDNMAIDEGSQVQRGHAYCIVDEVDNILIDEARTPLIISGPVASSGHEKFVKLNPSIFNLVKNQKNEINTLLSDFPVEPDTSGKNEDLAKKLFISQKADPKHRRLRKLLENTGYQKLLKNGEKEYLLLTNSKTGTGISQDEFFKDLLFYIDEQQNSITLTPKGESKLAGFLGISDSDLIIPDLGDEYAKIDEDNNLSKDEKERKKIEVDVKHSEISDRYHNIAQLLRAHTLFEKDVEYVVQDGKVQIVDEFTGRILPGRRYSDGLHQAIEAKEKVTVESETQTYATITLQNYFRMYSKLAGMTGTAVTEASEFDDIYKLGVLEIPTNRLITRIDKEDRIYKTKREKYNAIIKQIEDLHQKKQPVLVGTVTVEVSETISRMLKRRKVPHNVLNAKNHKREAEIVAFAGQPGAVTIATNMAGRGTDIKLGEGVKENGGLFILGTERHESRRIDLQLRGRAGRQGDPGESVFFLSLEDDLMRLFNSDRIISIMDRMGLEEGQVITHSMVTKSIERAQKKVEGRNFSIRKHLLEYDDVMNQQREIIYDRRNYALKGGVLKEELYFILKDLINKLVEENVDKNDHPDNWNWSNLRKELIEYLGLDIRRENLKEEEIKDLNNSLYSISKKFYENKEKYIGEDKIRFMERYFALQTIDDAWKDHLYAMDQLKEGINWRAYGQKDPLLEYKGEAYKAFSELLQMVDFKYLKYCYRTLIGEDTQKRSSGVRTQGRAVHENSNGMGLSGAPESAEQGKIAPVKVENKVGRNEPCPCGSGKKYKKCHGKSL